MPNYITNTAIVNESWNARGLITHNAVTKALVRADNGTLWAAVREGHVKEYINIYRSKDNGFSWENMYAGDFLATTRRTGIGGLNQNGPHINLTLSEERQRLILWHTFYDLGTKVYDCEPFIFEITDAGLERKIDNTTYGVTSIALNADELSLAVSYTTTHIYLLYTSFSAVHVKTYDHTYQTSVDGEGSAGNNFFNVFSSHANDDNTLDIAILRDDGANYALCYAKFNRLTAVFNISTIVSFPAADVADVNIERDGRGNLLVVWNQESADGTSISQRYATSVDGGSNWVVNNIPVTPFQTSFRDVATDRLAGRTVALGGLQGFLLGYVRLYNNAPYGYVRTLLANSTGGYDLSDEYLVSDTPITGYRFFRPTGNELLDLDQIGQVRIAYQIGYATSQIQVDVIPVKFGQLLLRESRAFAEPITTYQTDTPDSGQIVVSFNLLGAIDNNIDYYEEGLIGAITKKYINAFNKTGTVISFYKYEPNPYAETSDRSAYGSPDVIISRATLNAASYGFPMAMGNESFTSYIERDTRTLRLPPDFHLGRTFLVNAGNHMKRTVWLLRYDNNEYEISQIVPKFLKDQIAFYEANAYVVGPSNDPFSRAILPSET